ncbi:hypothetical protein [Bacillus norwichensis]|uniref:YesK-like protein n=1 Tax=Bacillus norwichensis TaxID=2762217 RepID=A0ABR8VQR4_9BACI|nr:hypothetical protein [Bacillus norwichensis]MBD8007083.1 hypothetical protein [Bacillus norwichensis]
MFFIILFAVLISTLLGIIHYLRKRKVFAAVPFFIMFLGFGTILVSIFFPGGFEGMAIGFLGFTIGILGLIWLIVYMIVKKFTAQRSG